MSLAEYSWLSVSPSPPGRWDLRLMGWTLHSFFRCEDLPRGIPALLDWRVGCRCPDWGLLQNKQNVIVIGVDDAETRSQLLSEGFGDALDSQHALVELAARLLKLEGLAKSISQQRRAGPLVLDLFRRDARLKDRCIGLHPREFGLLWRLAEIPHRQVSRKELLQDVWRLRHEPETNSLEVHVSRLRAKLAVSHLGWLVQTHPDVGYQLGSRRYGDAEAIRVVAGPALDTRGAMTQEEASEYRRVQERHDHREPRYD